MRILQERKKHPTYCLHLIHLGELTINVNGQLHQYLVDTSTALSIANPAHFAQAFPWSKHTTQVMDILNNPETLPFF